MIADVAQILKEISNSGAGAFAFGAIFAGIFTHSMYKLSSTERIARDKHDRKRESEILRQLENKDSRIDELHKEINRKTER